MALLDILKKVKKKASDIVGGAENTIGSAASSIGSVISNIEKGSQQAGTRARQQVNRTIQNIPQPIKTIGNIGANLVVPIDAAKQFGETLSKPFTNKYDLQALKSRQDKANADLEYAKLIKIKNPELSRKVLEQTNKDLIDIQKSASNLAKSQPTPLQIGAQAGNLALQTALSSSGLKAAGQGIKAISKSKGFVKPILKSAGIGAAAGGTSTALDLIGRGETDAKQIAKNALIGAGIGGAIGGVAPVAISGATKLIKETPKITTKVSQDIAKSLQEPKFQPGFASTKPKVELEPKLPKITETPEQLARETIQTSVQEPISPEIAPIARVSTKEDISIKPTVENAPLQKEISALNKFEPTPTIQGTPKDFKTIFKKYIGQRDSAELKGIKDVSSIGKLDDISAKQVEDALLGKIDVNTLSGDAKAQAIKLRQEFDDARRLAMQSGEDIGYIQDYLPRTYIQKDTNAPAYKTTKGKLDFAKERTFATPEEAAQFGYVEKPMTPKQKLADYKRKIYQKSADVEFVQSLKENNLISDVSEQGLTPFSAPGLSGGKTYYATKDVADNLKKYFDYVPQDTLAKTLEKTAGISGGLQDVVLSGGAYGTPINAFVTGQGVKAVASGQIKEFTKAFTTAFSDKATKIYNTENIDFLIAMKERNVPITQNLTIENLDMSLAKEIAGSEGLGGKLKKIWNSAVNDPTFKRTMPIYMTEVFKSNYKAALKKGLSNEVAKDLAANVVKESFGIISSDVRALRSKGTENFVSTLFFAPKYREAMIRFWGSNLKSISTNILSPEYKANRAFLIGASIMYAGYDYVNYQNTGKHLWENTENDKDKAIINIGNGDVIKVPILPSVATIPRAILRISGKGIEGNFQGAAKDAFQSFSSMLVKPIADVINNSDYFGNPIYNEADTTTEKLQASAKYLAKANLPALLKSAGDTKVGNELLNKIGLGTPENKFQQKSALQIASEALELPFRFSTQEKIQKQYKAQEWKKDIATIQKDLSEEDKKAWEVLHPPKTNSFGEEMFDENKRLSKYTRAGIYLNNPNVLEADRKLNQLMVQKGNPSNPLFELPTPLLTKVLLKEALPPGSKDPQLSALYKEEWFQDYQKARSDYYEQVKANMAKQGKELLKSTNPYPTTPPELQKVMDYYSSLPKGTGARSKWIKANPGLWQQMTAQWQQVDAWENKERVAIGLDEIINEASSAAGYGKGGGKTTKSKVKGDLELLKLKSQPKIKIQKLKRTLPSAPAKSIKLSKTKLKNIQVNKIRIRK